jgi:hypothetical protein
MPAETSLAVQAGGRRVIAGWMGRYCKVLHTARSAKSGGKNISDDQASFSWNAMTVLRKEGIL